VKIGSEIFYPALFDDVLYSVPGLIDYRIIITGEDKIDLITCKVEMNTKQVDIQEIISAILSIPSLCQAVKTRLVAEPRVEIAGRGELRRTGRGKQHLIDNRSE
jgi:phenylacetate-coenzyme A ligase PaaK-like adenylate-forming protein